MRLEDDLRRRFADVREPPLPPGFVERIVAQLPPRSRSPFRRPTWSFAVAAAVAVIALALVAIPRIVPDRTGTATPVPVGTGSASVTPASEPPSESPSPSATPSASASLVSPTPTASTHPSLTPSPPPTPSSAPSVAPSPAAHPVTVPAGAIASIRIRPGSRAAEAALPPAFAVWSDRVAYVDRGDEIVTARRDGSERRAWRVLPAGATVESMALHGDLLAWVEGQQEGSQDTGPNSKPIAWTVFVATLEPGEVRELASGTALAPAAPIPYVADVGEPRAPRVRLEADRVAFDQDDGRTGRRRIEVHHVRGSLERELVTADPLADFALGSDGIHTLELVVDQDDPAASRTQLVRYPSEGGAREVIRETGTATQLAVTGAIRIHASPFAPPEECLRYDRQIEGERDPEDVTIGWGCGLDPTASRADDRLALAGRAARGPPPGSGRDPRARPADRPAAGRRRRCARMAGPDRSGRGRRGRPRVAIRASG